MTTPTPHDDDLNETRDFDQWRKAQKARRGEAEPVIVFGRSVVIPTSLPLGFTLEMESAADSDDPEDTKRMVGILYGDDALDHWVAQGADTYEFQVLLAYGYKHASGVEVTFDEAAEIVQRMNSGERRGKAPRQPQDRKRKKTRSGGR